MNRRTLLFSGVATAIGTLSVTRWLTADDRTGANINLSSPNQSEAITMSTQNPSDKDLNLDSSWQEFTSSSRQFPSVNEPLNLEAAEWQERLDSNAYQVLRKEGTERPFSSALNDNKSTGLYVCAGCELPLFTSAMKFDSGTGWPSFFTTIKDHIATKRDFKLLIPRTEYHCKRCGGHQGHVFKDGPQPTGERWCNNGVALKFIPLRSA